MDNSVSRSWRVASLRTSVTSLQRLPGACRFDGDARAEPRAVGGDLRGMQGVARPRHAESSRTWRAERMIGGRENGLPRMHARVTGRHPWKSGQVQAPKPEAVRARMREAWNQSSDRGAPTRYHSWLDGRMRP